MKVTAAVLTASNCRETVSLFANYTSSKGGSNTHLKPPLNGVNRRSGPLPQGGMASLQAGAIQPGATSISTHSVTAVISLSGPFLTLPTCLLV